MTARELDMTPDAKVAISLHAVERRNPVQRSKGVYTLTQFAAMNIPDPTWVVKDMFVLGGTSLLAARPGVGKSALCRQLAVCVAKGLPFLGHDTMQGGVIYYAMEANGKSSFNHLLKLGASDADWSRIKITMPSHIEGMTPEANLLLLLEESKVEGFNTKLVIIDTLALVFPVKDGNDYDETSTRGARINAIAEKYGVHILLIHHSGKADESRYIGSTGTTTAIDLGLFMSCRGQKRFIESSKSRDAKPVMETALDWDERDERSSLTATTATDESGLFAAPPPKKESKVAVKEREILEFLGDYPGSNVTEIKGSVRGASATVTNILDGLVKKGFIKFEQAAGQGSPRRYSLVEIPIE